jgi:hypothetical protein
LGLSYNIAFVIDDIALNGKSSLFLAYADVIGLDFGV